MSASPPKRWLEKAADDLAVAQLVLSAGHTAHACFLSQQCIEKSLKAYMLARMSTYPRTHKLVDLLGECQRVDPAFAQFLPSCIVVDQYYLPTRYPDGAPGSASSTVPGEIEATEAVGAAETVLRFVMQQLP